MNCKPTNYILIIMFFRKITIFALLLFSAHFSIYSQKILNENEVFGNELSVSCESFLSENGFSPVQQMLSPTGQDSFAYNIILSFPETLAPEKSSDMDGKADIRRNEVIFCFMQEDFLNHSAEILDFLTFLKNLERSWTATVVLSALDREEHIRSFSIKGTAVFASQIDDSDSCTALTISFTLGGGTALYTGSLKKTTPLWLTKQLTDAFFDTKTDFLFENRLSAIYRLGIVRGQRRLSYFFMNNIPAIEINFSSPAQLSVLKKFAENYTSDGSDEWDMHYLYINRGKFLKATFINERTIIIACLSVGLFTILLLCVFSFIGENGERHKYEFIRTSYMIPFTIGLSLLSLILGQHFVHTLSSFISLNPIVQYGIKIVFSMIFISILFLVQGILKISVTAFMYGYILLVVAIFNIFLFATRDLTLFVIFATEYIIIYLSRSAKKILSLAIYFILMLLPFIPYGFIIIRSAEDIELTRTVFASTGGNLTLSLAIFPFQITWLRIMVFLNVRAGIKGYTLKRMVLNAIFSTISILAFITLIIFLISHFIYRPDFRAANKIETVIQREEKFTLSAKLSHDEFSGMNTNHIKIQSSEDALHYTVILKGEKASHPIYDSIYNYMIISDGNGLDSYSFVIPDYPPRQITIDYASDAKTKATIEITAYYKTENPYEFRTEKRELVVE